MHRLLLWMFTVTPETDLFDCMNKIAARLILLALPTLVTFLLWDVSNGWAVCAGMLTIAAVVFIHTTWYRWNVIEAPQRGEPARARLLSRLRPRIPG